MRVLKCPVPVAAVALAAILISVPVHAGALAAPGVSSIQIENFGRVNDAYYRGGQPTFSDFRDLAALGVKTIIDLTNETGKGEDARRAGLRFVQIPMSSTSAPSRAQVERFLSLVTDKSNQPVYVHCKGGRHRTGTMTAIYRMAHDGWNADRAYAEMLEYDFAYGLGHGGQKKFVFAFGADLERTRSVATQQQ